MKSILIKLVWVIAISFSSISIYNFVNNSDCNSEQVVHIGDVTDIPPPPIVVHVGDETSIPPPPIANEVQSIIPHLKVVANIIRERGNISDREMKALKFLSTEYKEGDPIYESLEDYLNKTK